ncbi:hypothetical protein RFI_15715 [Reticulomyxa filosa]|uniref:DJ-1/PfpI domain-containing protein n=1 Tax=Reticulomyxa filosa TaxID=46433 RepID=X6N5D9_RETFI|nr:hypothetical protein RFI_15715 [Reticulomyxa filosa]|eukprot:ETO21490.1 hypothetical protein RFI_15715 [Reticulomyxa filosa]
MRLRVLGQSYRTFCPVTQLRLNFSNDPKLPKVAVVLSGCGVYDGSEITEAVSTLIALSGRADYQVFGMCLLQCYHIIVCFFLKKNGINRQCVYVLPPPFFYLFMFLLAPNENQKEVINHANGQKVNESRNMMVESARIARGKIKSVEELKGKDYDAIIFPGGFGAAKNLSSFAVDGANCRVHPQVERVVKEFHQLSKPLGFCCIAPVLAARLISGVHVTVGSDQNRDGLWPYAETAAQIPKMGAKHVVKAFNLAHIDQTNKVVTAPAYMYEGTPKQIFQSVVSMVDGFFLILNKHISNISLELKKKHSFSGYTFQVLFEQKMSYENYLLKSNTNQIQILILTKVLSKQKQTEIIIIVYKRTRTNNKKKIKNKIKKSNQSKQNKQINYHI